MLRFDVSKPQPRTDCECPAAHGSGIAAARIAAGGGGGGASLGVGDRFSQLFGGSERELDPGATGRHAAGAVRQQRCRSPAGGAVSGLSGRRHSRGRVDPADRHSSPDLSPTTTSVRYQGTIVRNARDCTQFGGQVNVRVGVQGRIIVGPAGAPPAVDVPIRVAVVQEGVQPKTVATKLYRTQVDLGRPGQRAVLVRRRRRVVPDAVAGDGRVLRDLYRLRSRRRRARRRRRQKGKGRVPGLRAVFAAHSRSTTACFARLWPFEQRCRFARV